MNFAILIRLFLCIVSLGGFLYGYIKEQNVITELRLQIPLATRELQEVEQENIKLQFTIDQFENPVHLMELARRPEYLHLKHPLLQEITTIRIPKEQ